MYVIKVIDESTIMSIHFFLGSQLTAIDGSCGPSKSTIAASFVANMFAASPKSSRSMGGFPFPRSPGAQKGILRDMMSEKMRSRDDYIDRLQNNCEP